MLDLIAVTPLLFLISPLLVMLGILIRIKLGAPVIFCQQRPGINGRPFTLYKFRTMTQARDENGDLLPDVKRLTRFGRFLRSLSLDELPEFFNIIKGDMSLVGPRPLLMDYLNRYSRSQARRHEIKPGITGWAQVNGRNAVTWAKRFELDVWYVDHYSFRLDLRIIALTVWKIVKREGINQPGQATMTEFMGRV